MNGRIAVDSSTVIAFFAGQKNRDTDELADALQIRSVYIPPVVLSEVLSHPLMQAPHRLLLRSLPALPITDTAYWERAADIRLALLKRKRKANLPDALIAQSCIDHKMPLLTRDEDFRHYAEHCGLKLA